MESLNPGKTATGNLKLSYPSYNIFHPKHASIIVVITGVKYKMYCIPPLSSYDAKWGGAGNRATNN